MNNSYLAVVFFKLFYLIAVANQPFRNFTFRKKINSGNTKTQGINSPGYLQPMKQEPSMFKSFLSYYETVFYSLNSV